MDRIAIFLLLSIEIFSTERKRMLLNIRHPWCTCESKIFRKTEGKKVQSAHTKTER